MKTRSKVAAVLAVAAIAVGATGAIGYAIGSSGTKTKTVTVVKNVPVKTVSAKPTSLTCAKGAAPGSCNTDEAREAAIPDQPLDQATRAVQAAQLVAAREAALRYPTVADAQRAGFVLAGGFSPLTGTHYMDFGHAVGVFDPAHPGSFIYDGTSPTSKIIGLMYLGSDVNPPEGFAGPNDHWHRHANTCVIFESGTISVPFPADSSVTISQCAAVHGTFMRRTIWMVHAWVVPGWESRSGVFSHENTGVLCADGTTKTDAAGFCQGT
ncbi:MAG TPA: hypothetical protein VGP92_10690 [Acidimicrobiia bacterium]|jgi:hypothetical protein|nr:hypothetical protein [Acidimicrobiia bacterium]